MSMIPMFSYSIVGVGARKALLEMGFEEMRGRGKECLGSIEFCSEDASKEAKDAFYKRAEKLTRKGGKLGVEVTVHKLTRFMTRKGLQEFAKEMRDAEEQAEA